MINQPLHRPTGAELLAQLVDRKLACLRLLLALGQKQQSLIEEERIDALLEVLALKQQSLGELQQIDRGLGLFRDRRPEEHQWASAAERDACRQGLDDCQQLLAEIVSLERLCEESLVRRRNATAAQLQQVNAAVDARAAYVEQGPSTAGLDLTSDR